MRLLTRFVAIIALLATVAASNVFGLELSKSVYPGGFPIAMVLDVDGAVIDEVGFVNTAAGNASLANKLRRGDTITQIDGAKVSSCDQIVSAVEDGDGGEITLTLIRDGKQTEVNVTPYIDSDSGLYKLGVYIRDTISGVGTVTFVKENGFFAALGHKIIDAVAGDVPISGGKVYDCDVVGVNKGKRGAAGEIKATLKGEPIGEIISNTDCGVYGRFYDYHFSGDQMPLGARSQAAPGKAYVVTTVGEFPQVYEVEIIRAIGQTQAAAKGMLIRVTDKRLLKISGGIVQGMSGSPLMQNGKIVGAVTHVLVNDSTKGYAIYTDWMQSA